MDDELRETLARIECHLAVLAKSIDPLRANASDWIPLKRAAGDTGFSYECLRLWAADGLIAAQRVGGRWFVDYRALQTYLQDRLR